MALVDIETPDIRVQAPAAVDDFIRYAHRRIEEFQTGRSMPAFVPSDFTGAYGILQAIVDENLATGPAFCEWGSGYGVVTCLAAMLEFDAVGIEIDEGLVDGARQLANDFDLPAEFACGSFLPTGSEVCVEAAVARTGNSFAWLSMDAGDAHETDGPQTDDFDVIYAFPWPDEEHLIDVIFDRYANVNALLVTYNGIEGFRLRRKTATRSRKRPLARR